MDIWSFLTIMYVILFLRAGIGSRLASNIHTVYMMAGVTYPIYKKSVLNHM